MEFAGPLSQFKFPPIFIFQNRAHRRRLEQPLEVLQPRPHPQRLDLWPLRSLGHPDDRLCRNGCVSAQPT